MIFANIRPAIKDLIIAICPQGVDVIWRDQTDRYKPQGTKATIKLSLGPASTKGEVDRRLNYNAAAPLNQEMTETAVEYRKFTLKILCECLDQTDGATAWNYLETIRTRLGWRSSVLALLAVNVSQTGDNDLQDLSGVVDSRIQSAAAFDVQLATQAVETDSNNPFGYIATVSDPTLT